MKKLKPPYITKSNTGVNLLIKSMILLYGEHMILLVESKIQKTLPFGDNYETKQAYNAIMKVAGTLYFEII